MYDGTLIVTGLMVCDRHEQTEIDLRDHRFLYLCLNDHRLYDIRHGLHQSKSRHVRKREFIFCHILRVYEQVFNVENSRGGMRVGWQMPELSFREPLGIARNISHRAINAGNGEPHDLLIDCIFSRSFKDVHPCFTPKVNISLPHSGERE